MHIPDGYLSPQTAIPFIGLMVPIWGVAVNKVKKTLKKREVPVLAIGAAFSFTIMMFNLPVPGGSSAHAVGAVLLAVLLGPWAASIGVSIALIIQALVFGDGGILAIGANCFNIGVVMPFVGYWVYRWIKGQADGLSSRAIVAAAIGAYVGLNAAALCTAVEFGAQYHLFQAVDGTPLYFMYPMKMAVAAMMIEHLVLAGPVEAIITALGLGFVAKTHPTLMSDKVPVNGNPGHSEGVMAK
ncbi:MAG: cobalt transporter CbiM [Syntrophomonadaceae bacterium]|jgi:cobalt/nickel transport system permease protein|nr:cobalt transporter CbiM [Syntrophomonadaceae bacterium]